jgi:signal peptidase
MYHIRSVLRGIAPVIQALLIWNLIKFASGTYAPISIVVSGSMEPTLYRGDIIFAHNWQEEIKIDDVIIYTVDNTTMIVHRVIGIKDEYKKDCILTKGDNNPVDDLGIYFKAEQGLRCLNKKHVIGKVFVTIPYLGRLIVIFTENVFIKYTIVFCLIIHSIITEMYSNKNRP